ncbi:hypothetical protein IVA95_29105 [Bradyrhizobium sp. 157]|uniref:hypothetical protein n=1 Tax=Bradyrhizobium sp. 157 TaxID=2782631 RepID=UPI001FF8EB2F|nr:hypothetical protein [Bradyrhizobium sp. 157]MCK1641496.1 hypothetical protein [Bradyrhizobium sp. 157]
MRRFLRYLAGVCVQDKLPVWATILGIVIGALGTYFVIPSINEGLEKQKIKSEFVIRNLDDLNSRTRTLVSDVSDLHFNVLRTGEIDGSAVQKISSKIAEMQWKAIELAVIFEGTPGMDAVQRYQKSLDGVRTALGELKAKKDLPNSQAAIEAFSQNTLTLIKELAALAGLKIATTRAPKI